MGKNYSSASIRIDGLADLQSEMKRLSPAIQKEFAKEMQKVAGYVVAEVRGEMQKSYAETAAETGRKSRSTGRAQSSVRPHFSGNSLYISAGGARAPYYPWLDFGGKGVVGWPRKIRVATSGHGRYMKKNKRPFIKEGRWLYPTIARVRPEVYRRASAAIERAKKAAHFS
jgi:hypothetical protein